MNKNLMTIVLESLAFFELAGEELVDPDAAAEQTEGAVRTLAKLSPKDKEEFASFARSYADEEEAGKGAPERVEFFRTLPENFDLNG